MPFTPLNDASKDSTPSGPVRMTVAVLTVLRKAGDRPWDTGHWEVTDVLAGENLGEAGGRGGLVREEDGDCHYLWPGLRLELHRDAADSYYFNLMGERPSLFVVCREGDGGVFEPHLVTVSYDEATSYMEVEEEVFSLPMPAGVYRQVERFVLEHYVPEKHRKRKRENWKDGRLADDCPPGSACSRD